LRIRNLTNVSWHRAMCLGYDASHQAKKALNTQA